ncbi:SufE family protein [bacterium]|nr:SufE family protein [bacterium]
MDGVPPRLNEILETLALLPDRADRIELLIDTAERFREVPASVARRPFPKERLVPGCESQAYVWSLDRDDGTLDFHFAVENPQGISAKAMAAILQDACSGAALAQVAAVPDDVVYTVFGNELSMGKSMGLMGMVAMMRREAKRRLEASGK